MKHLSRSRNFVSFLLTMSAIFMASCFDQNDTRQESIYKGEILNYLNQLTTVSTGSRTSVKSNIPDLVNAIDFTKVEVYKLRTTEKAVIADLKPMESFGGASKVKALFYLNANKIVRSRIITFDDKVKVNDHDGVLLSILNNNDLKSYSGKVSFYSPFQRLMFFSVFENGNLTISGVAHNKKLTQLGGKVTDVCTDWYLVTTYYYTDGTTRTTQEYLYTTCDGEVSTGGGGGSGFAFPASPSNNDTFEFTDGDGKCTLYQFDCDLGWIIVRVILPEAVVQAQRDNYAFLPEYPYNRQTVFAPDYLTYKYNASSGDWEGFMYTVPGSTFRGKPVKDPALFLQCFDTNNSATLTLYVDQPRPGTRTVAVDNNPGHTFIGLTQTQNNGTVTVTRFFGFYPEVSATPFKPLDSGVLINNENHLYNMSISISITSSQLRDVIEYVKNTPTQYHLSDFNCTNFAVDIANRCGMNLPRTTSCWWFYQCGINPGDLGEDLRSKPGSVSAPNSHAPSSSGCPADLP